MNRQSCTYGCICQNKLITGRKCSHVFSKVLEVEGCTNSLFNRPLLVSYFVLPLITWEKKKNKNKKTIKLIVHGSKRNFISDLNLACVAGGISMGVLCIVLVAEPREAWVYKSITSRGGSDAKKRTPGTRIPPSTQENLDLNRDQVWRYRGSPPPPLPPTQTFDSQIGRGHDRRLTWACLAATTGSTGDLTEWKGHYLFLPFSTEMKSDANCEIDPVKAYKVEKFNRRLLFCFLYHCLFVGITRWGGTRL